MKKALESFEEKEDEFIKEVKQQKLWSVVGPHLPNPLNVITFSLLLAAAS